MPQMTSKTKSVGEIFTGTTKFEVPKHQRDYSWTAIEVEELFTDIESSQVKSSPSYYVGMLVLVEPRSANGRYQILDGQQRLTTLTLLFAAARDWCKSHSLEADGNRIQAEFIGFSDYGQAEHDPRIVLNSNNREVFEQFVVNGPTAEQPEDLEKTNLLLLAARSRCVTLLASVVRRSVLYLSSGSSKGSFCACDLGQDVLGAGGPDEGLGVRVVIGDVQVDGQFKFGHAGEAVALDAVR